ncbi:MAG TPA: TlpA disulfide reductase family protein [Burkholderiales bacterium]|nr:TlpA disulfide reductase family protein [Burkholderiales bacterium]
MTPGRRETLILGAAGIAAAAAGFLVGPALLRSTQGGMAGGARSGDSVLRSTTLVDLAGKTRRLNEWRGRILICNFWATWCAPCREEIPLLMSEREKYRLSGVEIVGIAIDNAAKVAEFATSLKIPYPILLADTDGLDLMRKLGNDSGGLPYTVIADRQGALIYRKLGAMTQVDMDGILEPLVRS